VQRYTNFIASTTATNSTLTVLSNASCVVYIAGTLGAATLYSDNGVTPLANPFLSSATGRIDFYAANGRYDVVVSKVGYLTVTISDIELDDLLAPSGSNSVGYLPAGTGAVATTVQTKLRESVSVKDFGAVGDGVANDTAAIQAAIVAVNVAGGGELLIPEGTYKVTSSITLYPNVTIFGYAATLAWSGSAAPVLTSSTSTILSGAGIFGLTIDGSTTATKLLELYSAYRCSFRDLNLQSVNTTNFALDLLVNTSGATNPDSNRNLVFCEFSNILQSGTCGTALRMQGNATTPTVVTLNTFVNFNARGCVVRGIDFNSWCDSNFFAGVTRVQINATNGVGVEWNTGTPASNVGVYSNNFDHLAVDTFSGGGYTGRIGIKMNWTKINKIDYYFNDPQAEGGAYLFDATNTASYYIAHQTAGTANIVFRQKLNFLGGADSPIVNVGGNTLTTENIQVILGAGRTANGFSQINLIGDATYTGFGVQLLRGSSGANAPSELNHRGNGNFSMKCVDAGGQLIFQNNAGVRLVTNDVGIGFYGAIGTAQPVGYGVPINIAKTASLPGTAATLAQVGGTLAALIADLKLIGLLGA
jgi:Pectate lyase superfamily protein